MKEKQRIRRLWQQQCESSIAHEDEIKKKDTEIAKLRAQLEQYLAIG